MKIIHQGGFTTEQLVEYRPIIYRNVVESARSVVIYMRKTGIECKESSNRVNNKSTSGSTSLINTVL